MEMLLFGSSPPGTNTIYSPEGLSDELQEYIQGAIREHLAQFIEPDTPIIISTDRIEAAYRLLFAGGWSSDEDLGPCPKTYEPHPDSIVVEIGTFHAGAAGPFRTEESPAFVELSIQTDETLVRWSWIDEEGAAADVANISFTEGIDTRYGAMEAACCRYTASDTSAVEQHNTSVLQWIMRAYVKMSQDAARDIDPEARHIREAFTQFQRPFSLPSLLQAELLNMQNTVDAMIAEGNTAEAIDSIKDEMVAIDGFITIVENCIRNGGDRILRD